MRLDESVCGLTGLRKSPSWNLAVWMLHLRVVLPSLAVLLFLFPSAVWADSVAGAIPGTGDVACLFGPGSDPYAPNCPDINYTPVFGHADSEGASDVIVAQGVFPGYSGFHPSGVNTWDATGNDDQEYAGCQYTSNCPIFDWRVYFDVPVGQTAVTITGDLAAYGPVAADVDGAGTYLGVFSTTAATPFTLTVAVNNPSISDVSCDSTECQNYIDFIFTGCTDWPSCSAPYSPNPDLLEPLSELYVDPSFTTALPGTPIDDIPESTLLATGGAGPVSPVPIPEPGSLFLLGTALMAVGGACRRRQRKRTGSFRGKARGTSTDFRTFVPLC